MINLLLQNNINLYVLRGFKADSKQTEVLIAEYP